MTFHLLVYIFVFFFPQLFFTVDYDHCEQTAHIVHKCRLSLF